LLLPSKLSKSNIGDGTIIEGSDVIDYNGNLIVRATSTLMKLKNNPNFKEEKDD